MSYKKDICNANKDIYKDLEINCSECFGFCCVALYFSTMDGFPEDKVAGEPCNNLNKDFTCSIHKDLRKKGLNGCTSFDCFGAGQKVAKHTYKNVSWKESKDKSKEMYDVFIVMKNLHEMIWYLNESTKFTENKNLINDINNMINKTIEFTNLSSREILNINVEQHRQDVNVLLKKVRHDFIKKDSDLPLVFDFIGKNLSKRKLKNENLAGALLIAANLSNLDLSGTMLIGADMRDTDIRGANLKEAMFITQSQINTAKGDSKTILPKNIKRPTYWQK